MTSMTNQQIADYRANGYLIIRDVVSSRETSQLRSIVQRMARAGAYPSSLKYPTPGKYTISGNRIAEPGLSPIAEHPAVVDAVEAILGQPAHLTAYVALSCAPQATKAAALTATTSDGVLWVPPCVGSSPSSH